MKFFKSVRHAIAGIFSVLKTEPNFIVQISAAIVMIILGIIFNVSKLEWIALVISSALVLILEMINTAVEKILDVMRPRLDERVGQIKDILAGAVLLASLAALLTGCLIFLPYLIERW